MKRALGFLIVSFFWLGVFECIAQYIVRNRGDSLERARVILRPDSELGWRQRSNLKTTFEEKEIATDSLGFRISSGGQKVEGMDFAVFGPSSAFGWGVAQGETYTDRVAEKTGWKSWNAGQVGYSIVQGRMLYEQMAKKKAPAQIVILAYGINDLDRYRFFGAPGLTDREYFKYFPKTSSWEIFFHSALASLAIRAVQESSFRFQCEKYPELRVRVGVENFRKELSDFVRQIVEQGAQPILLDTAQSLQVSRDDQKAQQSEVFYQKGIEAAQQGYCSEAQKWIASGRSLEAYRILRDVKALNQAVEEVAKKSHVPFLAISRVLEENRENFADPIHPSARGHELIAEMISNAVFKEGFKKAL